jgi:hypothetical protein
VNNDNAPIAGVNNGDAPIAGVIDAMKAKMDRFRMRLGDKDPITAAPHYGKNTAKRVKAVLAMYDALTEAIALVFGESKDGGQKDLQVAVAQQEEAA